MGSRAPFQCMGVNQMTALQTLTCTHAGTILEGQIATGTDPDAAATSLSGLGYDPLADRISWAGTVALLNALFSRQAYA
jgi:hypothetical protein